MRTLITILILLSAGVSYGQKWVVFGSETTMDSFKASVFLNQPILPATPYINPFFAGVNSVYLNPTTGVMYRYSPDLEWVPMSGGGGTNLVLTTTGSSGAASLNGDTLNIPNYAASAVDSIVMASRYQLDTTAAGIYALAWANINRLDSVDGVLFGAVNQLFDSVSVSAKYRDTAWLLATKADLNNVTVDLSGLVPYTGATGDVDLGSNGITLHDITVSYPSGSGAAATITKGGSGEALTVVKNSGSGNAMSVTGGVTELSELHLTTDLADAYIASATTWNAKVTSVSGTAGQIISTGGAAPVLSLETVNATPATYGSSTAIPVITIDGYGRATLITTVAVSGGGGGGTVDTSLHTITETTTFSFDGANGIAQQITMNNANDTVTLTGLTANQTYVLLVTQATANRVLYWGTNALVAWGSGDGQPVQTEKTAGALDKYYITRYGTTYYVSAELGYK